MSVRERARLGAIALGAGAAVLALIQILEQTVSAFSPRPIVSAAITVLVALVGATLARARSVATHRQFLSTVLRESPMPVAAESDPFVLGVFPSASPTESGPGPYLARTIDAALGEALASGGLLLLVGPARAGKTRSAYEAVLRAAPDRLLLIPSGGEALQSIVSNSALRDSRAVWWLDDLSRFLPNLDGAGLGELLQGGHVVVSTLRDDAWQALLEADGDAGEKARRLLAAAHVVPLSAELTPSELAEGARLYPGVDLTNGIGPALGTTGAPSAPLQRERVVVTAERRLDPVLGLALAATAGVCGALVVLLVGGGFAAKSPPSTAAQLEQIVGAGYRQGLQLVYYDLNADLHGLGQPSWILVWRSAGGSDDLRIYDDDGGRLVLRLDAPAPTVGGSAVQLVSHQLLDIDGFFENELVAAYSYPRNTDQDPYAQIPFVVTWNNALRRYTLAPLLSSLSGASRRSAPIPLLRQPVRLDYRSNASHAVRAYPVDRYDVLPASRSDPAVLVVAAATVHTFDQPTGCVGWNLRGRVSIVKGPNYSCSQTGSIVAITSFGIQPLASTDARLTLSCLKPLYPDYVAGPRSMGPAVEMLRPKYHLTAAAYTQGRNTDAVSDADSSDLATRARLVRAHSVDCARSPRPLIKPNVPPTP